MEKEIQQFFDFANQYVPLKMEDVIDLIPFIELLEYDKKETVLGQGDKCKGLYFVIDGLFRLYQLPDATDRSCGFMGENEFYVDFESLILNKECTFFIETIEPTRMFFIPYDKLLLAYNCSHMLERFGRVMTERALVMLLKQTTVISKLKSEEKYANFEKENKILASRIPLKHLASYIGITPESLSRIRKARVKSVS